MLEPELPANVSLGEGRRLSAVRRKRSKTMIKAIGTALIAMGLLSVPGSAAQITYLACDMPADASIKAGAVHFEYTFDEGKGTVSEVDKRNGTVSQYKAIFTHDSVTWSELTTEVSKSSSSVSRIDLSFRWDMVWTVPGAPMPDIHRVGKCSLVEDAARKF